MPLPCGSFSLIFLLHERLDYLCSMTGMTPVRGQSTLLNFGLLACPTCEERMAGICFVCKGVTSKLCGRCNVTYYCGAECQRADYKQHKRGCVSRGPHSDAKLPAAGGSFADFCQRDMAPRMLQMRAGLAGTFTVQCPAHPEGLPPDGAKVRVAWRVESGVARGERRGRRPPGGHIRGVHLLFGRQRGCRPVHAVHARHG